MMCRHHKQSTRQRKVNTCLPAHSTAAEEMVPSYPELSDLLTGLLSDGALTGGKEWDPSGRDSGATACAPAATAAVATAGLKVA